MNIDGLTIEQAREIAQLFTGAEAHSPPHPFVGQYCVFRGYKTGVYCGKLTGVVRVGREFYFEVEDARRMQYQSYNGFTLSSVASLGIAADSKLSPSVPSHHLAASDICEVFACNDAAEQTMREQGNG